MKIPFKSGFTGITLLLYTVSVTALFLWILFPSDQLKKWAENYAGAWFPGYRITVGQVVLQFPDKIGLSDIEVYDSGAEKKVEAPLFSIDHADIYPDSAASWQQGTLIFTFDSQLYRGEIHGTVRPVSSKTDQETYLLEVLVRNISLEDINFIPLRFERKISGEVSGNFLAEISLKDHSIVLQKGRGHIEKGKIVLQKSLFGHEALPFSQISGQFTGEKNALVLSGGHVLSPLLSAGFKGKLQLTHQIELSSVNLSGQIHPLPPFFSGDLQGGEMALFDKSGQNGIGFSLGGTLQKPEIRFSGMETGSQLRHVRVGLK